MFRRFVRSFTSWLRPRHPAPIRRAGYRPYLEGLEELIAPATWTGPAGGLFTTAANWDTGVVPGPGDAAIFGTPGLTPPASCPPGLPSPWIGSI